ncbi:MAG: hypothetical protein HYW24_00615 [Candidatus Aenigmarchaeota archaeon]|nr:hypothetical protein [Candidatus Aenigmarchaeota archaeon]
MDSRKAYVLGLFAGDGWFESRGVTIGTTSESFASKIKQVMEQTFNKHIVLKPRIYKDGHKMFLVSLHSKEICEEFKQILQTSKKKSTTFKIPEMTTEQKRSFVAGLFDAEGYTYLWKRKTPRVSMEIFHETASKFVQDVLLKDGIKGFVSKCGDGGFKFDVTGEKYILALFKLYPFLKLCPPCAG